MRKSFGFVTILLIACTTVFLYSCSKDEEYNYQEKIDLLNNDYFPLQVDNFWRLSNIPERKIDKVELINNKEYFALITETDTVFYRKEGDKIYEGIKGGEESLKFDLAADVGNIWTYKSKYSDDWNVTLSSKTDTIQLDNYTFYNCYRFFFDIPQMADDEHIIWLAPKVGFVEESYLGGTADRKKLEEVQINGINIKF